MSADPVHVPNRKDVAHESFDDEVILVHFPTGRYFRLDAPGRVGWAAVASGATASDVAAAFSAAFETDASDARRAADAFLATLLEHGLVSTEGASPPRAVPAAPAFPAARAPWSEPRLEVFTDLQDLFLVDPIHEVDEAGWPHAKP
jgi:hypothetical protein